jgi:hypothetical protein
MIIVGGLIRLLHWERFERLIDDLDFKCAHFLEVCQKYADRGGRLPDDSPFKSLAKMNYLIGLPIMDEKSKLENFLLGKYMPYDRTYVCLKDFIRTKCSAAFWDKEPTRAGRRLFMEAIENLQLVMGIFFGKEYNGCFQVVTAVLFNNNDVLQEYDDVYVQTKLEMVIADFFHDIFKERVSCNYPEHTMDSVENCAELLRKYLRDEMQYAMGMGSRENNWEKYPHSKYYSLEGIHVRIINRKEYPSLKPKAVENKKEINELCEWHLGSLLNVKGFNEKIIQCRSGAECRFKHDKIANITKLKAELTIKKIKSVKLQNAFEEKIKTALGFKK